MKLDRRHMIASVALLVGSIIYNVWAFTRTEETTTAAAPQAVEALNPAATGGGDQDAAGLVDPGEVLPLPDVALGRLPEWPRDPFNSSRARLAPSVPAAAAPVAPPPPEPDPVVSTILYSVQRRRAVVDGRIVGIGDKVGTATVADILPDAVIVDSPRRGRVVLSVRPAAGGLR